MELVRKIRENSGLKPWKFAVLLGKSTQSYLNLEQRTEKIALKDLIKLYELSGLTRSEFWELLERSACERLIKQPKPNKLHYRKN